MEAREEKAFFAVMGKKGLVESETMVETQYGNWNGGSKREIEKEND